MGERRLSVLRREARERKETPFGSVGTLHASADLKAWWIWKDEEDVDPSWKVNTRDDFLYVVQGALKLELRGAGDVVLEAGDSFVIPAGTGFRGYRWPRDGEPCLFVAVSPGEQATREELD
jgi:mannose-6-phosphate isomerase-like protein (cupin superfamily)